MQTLAWYARRLSAMSPAEIAWRVGSVVRDASDRYLLRARAKPRPLAQLLTVDAERATPGFKFCDLTAADFEPQSGPHAAALSEWRGALLQRAEKILANRLCIFDLEDVDVGPQIDWHKDYKNGRRAPLKFSADIDYRDVSESGDAKFVWEPNRHQHLVVLARAYRASGEVRFAHGVCEQLVSWLDQNPFGRGMNWRSPLELAIRLINWVFALELIAPSKLPAEPLRSRLLNSVWQHLHDVSRKYSRGSSANNHLIGEAVGVYVGASYFHQLHGAAQMAAKARSIIAREIHEQTYADGANREQATGYHLFALEFFLIGGLVARWRGEDLGPQYWARLQSMFTYVEALREGGPLPMFGDADDGYVLDLGREQDAALPLASLSAALFGSARGKRLSATPRESTLWLLGRDGLAKFDASDCEPANTPLVSRAFESSGLYLLQRGPANAANRISVSLDCGELGFKSIAAHGHADALSVTMRVGGVDFLVDPGTYDYFTWPAWRNYFRSTSAHNTLTVDGFDQSEMLGSFLWGARANARCVEWSPNDTGGRIIAEHDGYRRLADPVVHRRVVSLAADNRVVVQDEIIARGAHGITLYWHVDETWLLSRPAINCFKFGRPQGEVTVKLDPSLEITVLVGSEDPRGGWISRGYHRRRAGCTLVATRATNGPTVLSSEFVVRNT